MVLIAPSLRINFREWCVTYLYLRQIEDLFAMVGIRPGHLSSDRPFSGARRTLVEEYYASINWEAEGDVEKFLKLLGYALTQTYLKEDARTALRKLCQQEELLIDGNQVSSKAPSSSRKDASVVDAQTAAELKQRLLDIGYLEAQQRGYAFERFLTDLFRKYGMAPRGSFRLVGEQIDGSFEIDSDTYLVEARWRTEQTSEADLLGFRGKVEGKSTWARGLFVSYSGFSQDALSAFARGKATNLIGMTGQDLFFVLDGSLSLGEAIRLKARRAAETGEFFVRVFDLTRG